MMQDNTPAGYERLKYLKSSASKQKIVIPIATDYNFSPTKVTVKINPKQPDWYEWVPLFIPDSGWLSYGLMIMQSSLVIFHTGTGTWVTVPISMVTKWLRIEILFTDSGIKLSIENEDGQQFEEEYSFGIPYFESVSLFSNTRYTGVQELESVKIERPSATIDLIPLLRNADGKPGMYDAVSNTFYTNSGFGELGYEKLDGTYVAPV